jgi:hypothetical protein
MNHKSLVEPNFCDLLIIIPWIQYSTLGVFVAKSFVVKM